jgi:Zn-dependent metalloprotease
MDDYVQTTADNGGVHINSGIPNRAFYLAATSIGGYAWERTGRIWYEALRDARLRPTAQLRTFARITLRAAQRIGYDPSSTEYKAVQEAWAEVGLKVV